MNGTLQPNTPELKERVFESLKTAVENGYENVLVDSPAEIAEDLANFDAAVEHINPPDLEPVVAEWLGTEFAVEKTLSAISSWTAARRASHFAERPADYLAKLGLFID